jgi:hypothetical protein
VPNTANRARLPPQRPPVREHRLGPGEVLLDTVKHLELPVGNPVIVVVGWADNIPAEVVPSIERLFRLVIADIANEQSATFIDGGTDSGVMEILGATAAESARECTLIGVAPAGRIVPRESPVGEGEAHSEENHHACILVPGNQWGDELPYLAGLAERLAKGSSILMIVVGGGSGTQAEYELALRRGWPVMVLDGSLGQANVIADQQRDELEQWLKEARTLRQRIGSVLRSHKRTKCQKFDTQCDAPKPLVSRNGSIATIHINDALSISRFLRWRLSEDSVLRSVWVLGSKLDAAATSAKPRFRTLRNIALALGVITTAVGVSLPMAAARSELLGEVFRLALVLFPIVTAAILSYVARRGTDRRWIAVRAASEAIKREVYLYRAGCRHYRMTQRRSGKLASNVAAILRKLSETSPSWGADGGGGEEEPVWPSACVNGSAHPADMLLTKLGSREYIATRLDHQIRHYQVALRRDDRTIGLAVLGVSATAVIASLLAATRGASEWIAMAAIIAALSATGAAWLAYEQTEERVLQMSVALASLRAVRMQWNTKDGAARDAPSWVAKMVDQAEEALEFENSEWARGLRQAQQMFEAFATQKR